MSQAEDGSEANGRKLLTEAKFIKWSEKRSSKRGNSAMTGETWKVEEDNHFADEFASQEALVFEGRRRNADKEFGGVGQGEPGLSRRAWPSKRPRACRPRALLLQGLLAERGADWCA
ncbi:hypothetical protein C8F04DRAFT_1173058 [Mycena alexandri]|uniref:Uncharacterized protein n=1 Tax=Mycena alexandri TaxID=1745969 RepID=A0AAD6TH34_9AGAR|nr:hypothetical protein C8F04DRAFT_1173058 [Mycena alexandri]